MMYRYIYHYYYFHPKGDGCVSHSPHVSLRLFGQPDRGSLLMFHIKRRLDHPQLSITYAPHGLLSVWRTVASAHPSRRNSPPGHWDLFFVFSFFFITLQPRVE